MRTGEIEVGFREKLVEAPSLMLLGNENGKRLTCVVVSGQIGHSTRAPNSKHQITNEIQCFKFEISHLPLPSGREGGGAQLGKYFFCSHPARHCAPGKPTRHTQGRELCRTAPACLPRPDGVAGELHIGIWSLLGFGICDLGFQTSCPLFFALCDVRECLFNSGGQKRNLFVEDGSHIQNQFLFADSRNDRRVALP